MLAPAKSAGPSPARENQTTPAITRIRRITGHKRPADDDAFANSLRLQLEVYMYIHAF